MDLKLYVIEGYKLGFMIGRFLWNFNGGNLSIILLNMFTLILLRNWRNLLAWGDYAMANLKLQSKYILTNGRT